MADIKHVKTFQELVESIRAGNVGFEADATRQVIELDTDPELPGRMYIRWETHFPLVQLVQPILRNIPADRTSEVESAICRLNSLAMFPGLGFDYQNALVYFRIVTPIMVDGVRVDMLQAFVAGAVRNGKMLLPALVQVVGGAKGADAAALLGKDPAN